MKHRVIDIEKEIEDSKILLKENRNDKEMELLINDELISLEIEVNSVKKLLLHYYQKILEMKEV